MNFDEAFRILIGHEGGYTDGKGDPGGETKYGISKRSYPHIDIKNLTLDGAKAIYLNDFWLAPDIGALPERIRFDMFDAGVNHGPGQAARFLQRAVGVADDGVIGPVTMEAVRAHNPENLVARFNGERLMFFTKLKNWPLAGKGWARRVAKNLLLDHSVVPPGEEILARETYNVLLTSDSRITVTEGESQ